MLSNLIVVECVKSSMMLSSLIVVECVKSGNDIEQFNW